MEAANLITFENEAGFKVLFEYATISVIVIDEQGQILIVNPGAEELFGYKSEELVGLSTEILLPEDSRKKHIQHREEYFSSIRNRQIGLASELYVRKKNGEIFPVEISLGHYESTGAYIAVAFVTDITKRKTVERELRKINGELEKRVYDQTLKLRFALEKQKKLSDIKSRLVSMASHEFRTPLSTVLTSVSLIEQYLGTDEEDKKRKHINRIKSAVKNMTGILNDFLSLEKLEQGKMEIEKRPITLIEFGREVIEEVNGILKAGQKIIHDHSGEEEIFQDRKILHNILLNLLSNATKYSDEGKKVHMKTKVKAGIVSITIKDAGIGIPEEEQKHLFDIFFRAKNVDTIQGTGLGLNIVKRYVELINGTITFKSKVGVGTAFMIEFPLKEN